LIILFRESYETGKASLKKLRQETELHQKHLNSISDKARRSIDQPAQSEEMLREALQYVRDYDRSEEIQHESRVRDMISNERRSSLSPRVGSCVPAFAPYPNDFQDPAVIGGLGLTSYLDRSIGRMGGDMTVYPIGGDVALNTGVGEFVYSGANSGTASVRVDASVFGRWGEETFGGYWRNLTRLHVRTWDSGGQLFDGLTTIHDNSVVAAGVSIREFVGDSFSATVFLPSQSFRWYLVWAWVEQYTVGTPLNSGGGQNLSIFAQRLEICT
jgi:hypothetical protein